jgi:hypothetical protein
LGKNIFYRRTRKSIPTKSVGSFTFSRFTRSFGFVDDGPAAAFPDKRAKYALSCLDADTTTNAYSSNSYWNRYCNRIEHRNWHGNLIRFANHF